MMDRGEVFGSPTRCAICDGPEASRLEPVDVFPGFFCWNSPGRMVLDSDHNRACCDAFTRACPAADGHADSRVRDTRIILRARSIYREESKPMATDSEVEGDAILGAPDRCAVCGGSVCSARLWRENRSGVWTDVHPYADAACFDEMCKRPGDSCVRAILRARRVYREAKPVVAPTAAALPAVICPKCELPMVEYPTEDAFMCHCCGVLVSSFAARALHSTPAAAPSPPAPSAPTCWKCGGQATAVGGMCLACCGKAYAWSVAQDELAAAHAMEREDAARREEARQEKRRRVLLGLERGTDPQLVGGVCSPWTFDPWRQP